MGLRRADFEAILDFLACLDTVDSEGPYGRDMRAALGALIPSDLVGYDEADLDERRFTDTSRETAEDDALYWALGPCPITEYRSRTADATAARMSDVVGRGRWHELPLYREYFKPVGLDHILDMGLSSSRRRYRTLTLFRGGDVPDFSERDRTVLELLRPHLRAREARTEVSRLAAGIGGRGDEATSDGPEEREAHLTVREREIVALVGAGKTNAQIAADLWVAPATVKKHLENVYLKLGVGSRVAAANAIRARDAAG
jgi:DNA-binding CsgD family transcriptional regulator